MKYEENTEIINYLISKDLRAHNMTLSSLEIKIQLASATIFHYSMKLQDAYFSKASLFFCGREYCNLKKLLVKQHKGGTGYQ